jgi:geranylgeranyl pyrophosphate synthase
VIRALQKYAVLKDVIQRCDDVVAGVLGQNKLREANIALESFNNGGKRLRPALLVLSSMVPHGNDLDDITPELIDLAGAVELVHLATLFHDDVIDGVDKRREKLSARLKYGNYASVLTGDLALAEALELVQRSGRIDAMPEFIRTLRVLVRGESVETANKFNYDISEAEYYDIISEKSASLFALSCKVGALSQGPEYADTLGHFGWNLGMAFQMIDDLDDIVDNPNHSYDCDLRNGYLALPVIRVLGHLTDGHRDRLVDIIEKGDFSGENERFIVSLCMELGSIEETNVEITKHLTRAGDSLGRFATSRARDLLGNVVEDLKVYADRQVENFATFLREPTA